MAFPLVTELRRLAPGGDHEEPGKSRGPVSLSLGGSVRGGKETLIGVSPWRPRCFVGHAFARSGEEVLSCAEPV